MLDIAGDRLTPEQPMGRVGVRTHQALIAILGAAEQRGERRAVLREALDAIFSRGAYAGSAEELTPLSGDPLAAVPVAVALAATLAYPPLWRKFYTSAVGPYAGGLAENSGSGQQRKAGRANDAAVNIVPVPDQKR